MNESDPADDAFRSYLKAQMPSEWPGPPRVATPSTPAKAPNPLTASRWVMALAAMILLGLGLLLNSTDRSRPRETAPASSDMLRSAEANGAKLLQPMPMDPDVEMP